MIFRDRQPGITQGQVDHELTVSAPAHRAVLSRATSPPSRGADTMIGTATLDRGIGADVIDADGNKIGTASEVFLDDQSGTPEWVTVKTGLFGTKETFVPIRDADLTGDGLRVPVSKDAVKDAPKIDTDGHLSPQEEQELYRYYSMGTGQSGHLGGQTTGRDTDVDFTRTGAAETTTNTGMGAGMTGPTGDTRAAGAFDDTNRHGTRG